LAFEEANEDVAQLVHIGVALARRRLFQAQLRKWQPAMRGRKSMSVGLCLRLRSLLCERITAGDLRRES
jgi:hypothetical protein